MTVDSAGNLYGTYYGNSTDRAGGIFELTARGHQYVSLHDFEPGEEDEDLARNVVVDSAGDFYGVSGNVVWAIMR